MNNQNSPYLSVPFAYSSFENQKLDPNMVQTTYKYGSNSDKSQFYSTKQNPLQNQPPQTYSSGYPKTMQNFYKHEVSGVSPYEQEAQKERDPKHINSNYLQEHLSYEQKQYLNNQDIKYDYNSTGDNLNFRKYLDERYELEKETIHNYEINSKINNTYNRYNVMRNPCTQTKMRFSYIQPSPFDRTTIVHRKNQFKSQLESLKKYDYQPIRPDVTFKDERQKFEFQELQEFFDVLKEAVWTEIQMEEQRCDIGKQMDFSVPDLYREYFHPFLARIKREEIRSGFHSLEVNLGFDDITLLIERFCLNDTKNNDVPYKQLEYEEFKNMFVSKTTKYAFDHMLEEKRKSDTIVSVKTMNKVTRYLRSLAEQEQQFETYRVKLLETGVDLSRVFKGLTKYRDGTISCHDLMYFFLRNCMQVSFDQFRMFFERLDPVNQSEADLEQFLRVFKPKLV